MFVAKVTNGRRCKDAETVSNRGMKVGEGDKEVEETRIQEGNPAIDEVTL